MKKLYSIILLTVMLCAATNLQASNEEGTVTEPQEDRILTIDPEAGSKLAGFVKGSTLTFTTTFDEKSQGMSISIIDLKKKELGLTTDYIVDKEYTTEKDEEGRWMVKFYSNIEFMKGHLYQLTVEGHAEQSEKSDVTGTAWVTYEGDGVEYNYSDVILSTLSPTDGSELLTELNNNIFMFFSDAVKIDAERSCVVASDGSRQKFTQIVDYKQNAKQYQLIIPTNVMKTATGEIKIMVYAVDANGNVVKGNTSMENDSHFEFTYICNIGYPSLALYPAQGSITELESINITYDQGMVINNSEAELTLYKSDKKTVIESIKASELGVAQEEPLVASFTLTSAIRQQGTYYLHIPAGVFGLGERMLDNQEMWVAYTVADRMATYGVTISPTDGKTVKKLDKFTITFNNWDAAAHNRTKSVVKVVDENGNTVTIGRGSTDSNRTRLNQCVITLDEEVTQTGYYRLIIPEQAFILGSAGNNHNDEMYFEYTVEGGQQETTNVTVTAIEKDGRLDRITLWFNDYEFTNLTQTPGTQIVKIYDSLGNEVGQGKLYLGGQKKEIYVQVDSETAITTTGTYKVVIPGGYLKLNAAVFKYDLSYTFKFEKTTGISNIQTAEVTGATYNMAGQHINQISRPGIYIKNGRKIIIK